MATYTIKKGDNLLALAEKWGVSTSAILDANPGVYGLGPGVTLRIPTVQQPQTLKGPGSRRDITPRPPIRPPYVPPPPPPEPTRPGGRRDITPPPPIRPPYVPPPQPPTGPGGRRDITPQPPVRPAVPPPTTYIDPGLQPYVQPPPRYTGPYAPPAQQQIPPISYAPTQIPGRGAGFIPAAYQVGQEIAERVSPFLDRLFRRREPRYVDPATAGLGEYQPAFTGHRGYFTPAQEAIYGQTPTLRQPPAFTGHRGYFTDEQRAEMVSQGLSPEQARTIALQAGLSGVDTIQPIIRALIERGFTPEQASLAVERGQARTDDWLDEFIRTRGLPSRIFKEDLARLGITEAELIAAGYIQDEYGDWWRGGMEPWEVERAVAEGGGGAGGYYPRRGRGRGGVGRTDTGGVRGAYTYPQSFVGREGTPYPQSFVQRGQRGVTPTGRSIRPARMGAVTWRI